VHNSLVLPTKQLSKSLTYTEESTHLGVTVKQCAMLHRLMTVIDTTHSQHILLSMFIVMYFEHARAHICSHCK